MKKETPMTKVKHIVGASKDHGIVSPVIEEQVKDEILVGQGRALVAQASGFAHAVARDLDLMVSGIMVGRGSQGLIAKLEKERDLLMLAVQALGEAQQGIAEQEAEGARS